MADPYNRATYPWGHEDAQLVEAFREIMTDRMATPALRTGSLRLTAIGSDVVLVERRISGGADVFGRPAQNQHRALAVNRCCEQRRIEYGGRVWEIPPESAIRLAVDPCRPSHPRKARWTGKRQPES